jgi:hypothetical protein
METHRVTTKNTNVGGGQWKFLLAIDSQIILLAIGMQVLNLQDLVTGWFGENLIKKQRMKKAPFGTNRKH